MTGLLDAYAEIAGEDVIHQLRELAEPLRGLRVVHVNSTRIGGGVAEMLHKSVPLLRDLGMDASWEVVEGPPEYYRCTKTFHNGLQGDAVALEPDAVRAYEETVAANAERLRDRLDDADVVFIHDPQPLALIEHASRRRGKWVWRCHIDASHPHRDVWAYLEPYAARYDASIFSLSAFARALPHPEYLIPPSIDPLSDKNRDLEPRQVLGVRERYGVDPDRLLLLQVSRFDRFKDPLGVLRAYRLVKRFHADVQLVLAGGGATDDPEGARVLEETRAAVGDDPDVHLIGPEPLAAVEINALQRAADVVIQKSIREGFGMTVTEALWKGKPVIGGNVGGIRLQVINHHTGFRVSTPEGAALRIRYLLNHPELVDEMGAKAREFVRENFLVTRDLREHLTLMLALVRGHDEDRIILG